MVLVCLYRTSSQANAFVEALKRSGMPFAAISNNLIIEKKWVKHLLTQLKDKDSSETLKSQVKAISETLHINQEIHILEHLINLAEKCDSKEQFFNEISVTSEIDTLDERADRISLMTLDASKGLEFKAVFITGLEDGILPLYRGNICENMDEKEASILCRDDPRKGKTVFNQIAQAQIGRELIKICLYLLF